MHRVQRGFTFIELLTAIAIVTIVVSVLVASYLEYRAGVTPHAQATSVQAASTRAS